MSKFIDYVSGNWKKILITAIVVSLVASCVGSFI